MILDEKAERKKETNSPSYVRCITVMNKHLHQQLLEKVKKKSKMFSLQLDESTNIGNKAFYL
jgi:Mor family transcriptional regulator